MTLLDYLIAMTKLIAYIHYLMLNHLRDFVLITLPIVKYAKILTFTKRLFNEFMTI